MMTSHTGAATTPAAAVGRAQYMVRQTVQHLGMIHRPNVALAQYYVDMISRQQATQAAEVVLEKAVERPIRRVANPSLDVLDAALRADIDKLAEQLLGKPRVRTRTEMRWGSKGSFSLDLGQKRGAWFDHESQEYGGPLLLIQRARGRDMKDAIEWGFKWAGIDSSAPEPVAPIQRATNEQRAAEAEKHRLERQAYAQKLWSESVPLAGTVAEKYLTETRGVPRQLFGWPEAFAYHPRSNSLIVGLTDAEGTVRAVQRVILDAEGRKAQVDVQKPTSGMTAGLAVRLPGAGPSGPLVLAEGPETGMSVWAATGYETWISVGSVTRMTDILPTGRPIIVALDDHAVGDPAQVAMHKASIEWAAKGLDIHFARPWSQTRGDKSDFNDLLKAEGTLGVKRRFRKDIVTQIDPADLPNVGVNLREDTHPALLKILKIPRDRALSENEIAHLMNATTTRGENIEGKTYSQYKEKLKDGTTYSLPVGFIDLTWTPDKSVSLAWAFAVSDQQRQVILESHKEAVAKAMAMAETVLGMIKIGDGGNKLEPGFITWLSFDHYTARPTVELVRTDPDGKQYTDPIKVNLPGDPNLHTHCIVPNIVYGQDGKLGSIYSHDLDGKVKQLGAYYQACLATALRRRGGIDVDVDQKTFAARMWDIPGIARDAFSKRTARSETVAKEFAAKAGLDWDTMTQEARSNLFSKSASITRIAKESPDSAINFEAWHSQAEAIGWRPANVLRPGEERGLAPRAERIEAAYTVSLPWLDDAFKSKAVLTEDEIRTIAARGLITTGIEDWKDINRVTLMYRERGVLHNGERTDLVWAPDPEKRWRMAITTALHESEERELISLVRKAAGDQYGSNQVDLRLFKQFADASGLDFTTPAGREQFDAAVQLGSGGRFGLVIGVAGSGKSSVLRPLVNTWQAEGKNVIGMALAWRQTEALEDAGIKFRRAIDPFLRNPTNLTKNTIVVIDEIGQVSTHELLQLVRLQKQIGFSIVCIGDPKQCEAIQAGPVIELMGKALGDASVPKLMTTIRQKGREAEIAGYFREGEVGTAISMKRQDNTARLVPGSRADVVKHVANTWADLTLANADRKDYKLTVMTPTNADAHDISAAIREKRREWGQIGEDLTTIQATDQKGRVTYDLPIAIGDKLRLFGRTNAAFTDGGRGNIGHNGSVLTVTGVRDGGVLLKDKNGREGFVKWTSLAPRGQIKLAYGDVLTVDAGQGISSTEHLDVMPRTKAYVSESRHRERSFMIVSDGAERQQIMNRRPIGDERPITEEDVWQNVIQNLSRKPKQESATGMIARLVNVRRSCVALQEVTAKLNERAPGYWPRAKITQVLTQAVSRVQSMVQERRMEQRPD